ncbi:Cu+-exporting ATPase [Dinghuibacter silviterrae]|uniref:Cu+-exporting ATPase n=2 Tax=Dinghuibacter silviterrae TaxID=1539049 RepID=A0A4R8DGV0_9BACT|nr:Cu+-exporting ATPase [Dinghuibacter silviterrae]
MHCGEDCPPEPVRVGDLAFCCEGCRMVYQLLDRNGLCTYYNLNERPGVNRRIPVREDKFAFLDDAGVAGGLVDFSSDTETHVRFYLPAIHCSSCLYLLEHLHKLEEGISLSRVDFAAREVSVVFDPKRMSLRKLAELLTSLGYEPYISLKDWGGKKAPVSKGLIYQLGVAGFCFANIMLISFPEYLGLDHTEPAIRSVFRFLNLLVSLPVVLYAAQPFYISAWKGLRHRFLNIDAPIVLAIAVTFGRSLWEVWTGHGSGYFDSLTGIVFFMLLGRVLQDKTYRQLSFDRDYTSYFPVAVTVLVDGAATVKTMPAIRAGDTLKIHSGELIPADGILTRGRASIDYSFVTGESTPVDKSVGELLYAGGRQEGGAIELLVVREVAQSYLTQLWNRKGRAGSKVSFVHPLARYFTYIVLSIAAGAALYWMGHDPSRIWNTVTAVLIVACPCALLLSSTFTNGNLLRILGRNHFYLRNAEVIERIAGVDHIVFDKTGTLTAPGGQAMTWTGEALSEDDRRRVATLAAQSAHPLSRALARELQAGVACSVLGFEEHPGAGIKGFVDGEHLLLGSAEFVGTTAAPVSAQGSRVYVSINSRVAGFFEWTSPYRAGLHDLVATLQHNYTLSVLSGDNDREKERLAALLGPAARLHFHQTPKGKVNYIRRLQAEGDRVMMIGDGLNDAGALERSDAGIALTDDCNNFTPASDAILRSDQIQKLPAFIRLCRSGKHIILASFILSVLYNLAGLSFAVSGALSPMVAAILMPSSSLTILLVTYGSSSLTAKVLKLYKTSL